MLRSGLLLMYRGMNAVLVELSYRQFLLQYSSHNRPLFTWTPEVRRG
jgi:hypothetical protein